MKASEERKKEEEANSALALEVDFVADDDKGEGGVVADDGLGEEL